jgi:hypothetical protein
LRQAGLELMVLVPQLAECSDYRCAPPYRSFFISQFVFFFLQKEFNEL